MKRIRGYFCFIFLIGLVSTFPLKGLEAQRPTKFSGDSTKFIGELNTLFKTLGDKEQKICATMMNSFIQKWNAEKFPPSSKQIIYYIGNQMLIKRMVAYPDLYNFVSTLDIFIDSHQPDGLFTEWAAVMKKVINGKASRPFLLFLDNSNALFGENLVYKSPTTEWKVTHPDIHFSFDTVPRISFASTDLICYSSRDSIKIYNTQGVYFPMTTKWVGSGGRVDWRHAALDPGQIYADLHSYEIQMRFSKFTADSVDFYNKKYFPYPLPGRFSDKTQPDITPEHASFPAFESYDKLIGIPELFKNIDYTGGFSMEGEKIIGSGSKTRNAQLSIKNGQEMLMKVKSRTFVIRPDRISSGLASMTIYYENDSIFHPGLQMKYMVEKKELTMSKDEMVRSFSPWFDSYHRIEIYCEELVWKIGEPKIDFGMMRGPNQKGKAVFESSNYYTIDRYDKLQGIDEQNPLAIIKSFMDKKKKREFTLEEMCMFMQRPPEQVELQLLNLAMRGFLIYDAEDKWATIKEKLIDYVKAKNNKTDYDVIYFNSDVERKSNAILVLDSFELRIQGVKTVFLSDSQRVYIYPAQQEIILQKNRNFRFSGKVDAGLFEIYTRDGSFDYNRFKLNLPLIDSLGFWVIGRKIDPKSGKFPLVKVKTSITNLTGELLIDDPQNKSGLKPFKQYPIFTSKKDALVTWDKKYILNGVYKKESFFYKVYPFTFKRIARFSTDSLQFNGYLSSTGIFPEIEQPLKVRPDYSLGIETQTDSAGLPLYGGKGRFINRIDLSNEGLRGDGRIVFLNSNSVSDNFIFYPDSMKTIAKSFRTTELLTQVEFPAVHGDSVNELWLPYKDSLIVKTNRKDLAMYNDQATFSGNISLASTGLIGEGIVRTKDAEMDSKRFLFKKRTFDANIANFRIKSYNLSDLSISTKNYQTHFDFDIRRGEFKSNVGISKVDFPINRYTCSMDHFDWQIDKEEIILYNEKTKKLAAADTMRLSSLVTFDFAGSEFISNHPKQDSLRFFALRANYNLRTNVIRCQEVKIIKVADAAIFPDSGKVTILKDAQITPLSRAIIIANQKTKYHQFYNAGVSITSRKKYSGSGNYDYMDRTGEKHPIRFSSIAVDTNGHTVAQGVITDSVGFRLSPEFAYTGEVTLMSDLKNLTFDGGYRALTECFRYEKSLVQFRSEIDPINIQLPVSSPLRDIHNEKIYMGIGYNNAENKPYAAFFSKKMNYNDSILFVSTGTLTYNEKNGVFSVTTPEKQRKKGEIYNSATLSTEQCILHTDGKLSMNLNAAPLTMEYYGGIDYFVIPDSAIMHVAIAINFPFAENALEKFSQQIQSINLPGITIANTPYAGYMKTQFEPKVFDQLRQEFDLYGKYKKFPEELIRTIFLADVRMKWAPNSNSWISYGSIGIGNVGKNQLNRYSKGIIEFAKKKNGDEFTIYLELTKDDWYFFNYRNNILQVISSNLEFNDMITEAQKSSSEHKRLDNIAKGFRYIISTDRKKKDFLRKFETEL